MFNGDRRPATGNAVQSFHLVEPFTFDGSFLQIEASGGGVESSPSALTRFDRHEPVLRPTLEHNKNERTSRELLACSLFSDSSP